MNPAGYLKLSEGNKSAVELLMSLNGQAAQLLYREENSDRTANCP